MADWDTASRLGSVKPNSQTCWKPNRQEEGCKQWSDAIRHTSNDDGLNTTSMPTASQEDNLAAGINKLKLRGYALGELKAMEHGKLAQFAHDLQASVFKACQPLRVTVTEPAAVLNPALREFNKTVDELRQKAHSAVRNCLLVETCKVPCGANVTRFAVETALGLGNLTPSVTDSGWGAFYSWNVSVSDFEDEVGTVEVTLSTISNSCRVWLRGPVVSVTLSPYDELLEISGKHRVIKIKNEEDDGW
ncbi:hypothetical protein QBC44DRAFT_367787 [Cladorrhinum sp. PSN332]|nr:hypothetical protein QBC44DRAFT_367787 [Cladorrhinum sp. PSN332]